MTFNPSEFFLWNKEYPMFSLWASQKGILFLPKEIAEDEEFKKFDLTSKIYVLMKRLNQDYNRIMLMDAEERDKIFEIEMRLIKEEAKQRESNGKN